MAAALAAAPPAPRCNVESASLTPGLAGEGSLKVSGWITEMTFRITSPDGMIRIQGPGVDMVGPLKVDISRPDVANAMHNPSAEHSAYVGSFFLAKPPRAERLDQMSSDPAACRAVTAA
jgi:hypothetical protein